MNDIDKKYIDIYADEDALTLTLKMTKDKIYAINQSEVENIALETLDDYDQIYFEPIPIPLLNGSLSWDGEELMFTTGQNPLDNPPTTQNQIELITAAKKPNIRKAQKADK